MRSVSLPALFGALALGCGMGCKTPEAEQPTALPGPEVPALGSAEPGEVPLVPLHSREALAARVSAQRALLGADAVLFEDADGQPVPWISEAALPVGEPTLDDALLDALPGSSGLGGGALPTASVNGNSLGLFSPIDDADEDAAPLAEFHAALRKLQGGGDPDGKVRVLVWGASHTDADVYTHYVRSYLRERFGDGGHGFVQLAKPWRWYGHMEVSIEGGDNWRTEHAQRQGGSGDGHYGLLGASIESRNKRASGRVAPQAGVLGSRYEIFYLAQPRGGRFRVYADGRELATVTTRGSEPAAGYHAFTLADGAHVIDVQPVGDGVVRLFGMTIERDTPGVVVDTLGIGGTRAANMLEWDERTWGDNVQRRAPDLVVLAYGTNEASDDTPLETYEADLRSVLEKIDRVAPQASCLLVGPGDFPLALGAGGVVVRPRVDEIIAVQRRVASQMGCGFWDMQAFMGGPLSIVQWASASPPMAKPDLVHLTRRGYVRMGMALADALMLDFDGDLR